MDNKKEIAIISVEQEFDPIKKRNLFYNILLSNTIWMIFHFSVFYFFTFKLKSIALVWIFLWIWNLFAFLLDISIWVLQKYFRAKTLFIISYIAEILAMLIFVNFTLQIPEFISKYATPENLWFITTFIDFFLWKWVNFILLLIACFCYWFTKEMQEVTIYSYILNNASHNEYVSEVARKNIATWIWAFFGLILSWVILTAWPNTIIFLTIMMILLVVYFTINFFDNWEKAFNLQDIYKFKVIFNKDYFKLIWNNLKNSIIKTVNKIELKNIINSWSYVFLSPVSIKSWLSIKVLVEETKKQFFEILKVLANKKNAPIIYWSIIITITFGFWDTFASTFLIKFLDNLWNWKWYFLLGIIAVPAFWLQDYFSRLSQKYGVYNVSNAWLVMSWISIFLLWIFSNTHNILLLMIIALINSIWYAACITLSQAAFLETYNKAYALENNLKEIDANASAAPLKLIQNAASMLWLFFWWIFLDLFSYLWFFIIFSFVIVYILYWTIKNSVNED